MRSFRMNIQRGYTFIELIVVIGLLSTLMTLATINLTRVRSTTSLDGSVDVLVGDLKQQQLRAMTGDGGMSDYGVSFGTSDYTLFKGASAGPTDYKVFLNDLQSFTSVPTGSIIIFLKGSGEVKDFTSDVVITVKDNNNTLTKTITINKYGSVISGI